MEISLWCNREYEESSWGKNRNISAEVFKMNKDKQKLCLLKCEIICRLISYWFCLLSAGRHVGRSAFSQFVVFILFWLNIKLIGQKLTVQNRFTGWMNKWYEVNDWLMCSWSEVYILYSSSGVLVRFCRLFSWSRSALQNIQLIQVFFLLSSFWFKYFISI